MPDTTTDGSVFSQTPLEWHYGRDNDKTLLLYPMSMADQIRITGVITEVLSTVMKTASSVSDGNISDLAFVNVIAQTVRDNFITVAAIVTGKPEDDPDIADLPMHVTNMQLMEFVQYVWETNYGNVRKNYDGLFSLLAKMRQVKK